MTPAMALLRRESWPRLGPISRDCTTLSGTGKGGTKFKLELLVAAKGAGSEVTVDIDLGGAPLFGMMCLCYVAIEVGARYADRAIRTLIGSQVDWAWFHLGPPVST